MSDYATPAFPDFAVGQAAATAREASNLVSAEDEPLLERFVQLAVLTNRWLPQRQSPRWLSIDTCSASCGVFQISMWRDVPREIERGWSWWKEEYLA